MPEYAPKPKARVHEVFLDCIEGLASQSGTHHDAERGGPPRRWAVPEKAGDLHDVAGATAAFDRKPIDDNYADCVTAPSAAGTVGDAISLKSQGDYVAVMERAFRARHCTPVRLLGFAAARRRGHSDPNGVLLGGVLRYAQDALKAGQ